MERVSPSISVPRGLLSGHSDIVSTVKSKQHVLMTKTHASWEQVGLGSCSDWKSTSRVNLAGRYPARQVVGKVISRVKVAQGLL